MSVDKIPALQRTAMFQELERRDLELLAERAAEVRLKRVRDMLVRANEQRFGKITCLPSTRQKQQV